MFLFSKVFQKSAKKLIKAEKLKFIIKFKNYMSYFDNKVFKSEIFC